MPAVNQLLEFGRWAFLETRDPWNVMNEIKEFLQKNKVDALR
jgi:hypothetical protein